MKKLLKQLTATLLAVCMAAIGFPFAAFTQTPVSTPEEVLSAPPTIANGRIVLPKTDAGTLSLYGSSAPQIVALDGAVTSPLIDTTVSLLYQLQTADGVVTSQKNVKLTVPGRYSVEPTDNPKPDVLPSLRE